MLLIVETAHAAADAANSGGGLPQLNVLFDGSFTNQLIWLGLTFVFLYLLLSQLVLPRLASVLTEREEAIAADQDRARSAHREAEKVKAAYEDALAEARMEAQASVAEARSKVAADLAAAQADLDKQLAARAADAETRVAAAVSAAMDEVGGVAAEVAGDLVSTLTGEAADSKTVQKAVDAQLDAAKGA